MMLRIKLYIFYCQESMICVSQGFESQRSSESQRVRVLSKVTSHELRKSDLSQSSHKSVCVCVKNTVDLGSSMKSLNVWVTSANRLNPHFAMHVIYHRPPLSAVCTMIQPSPQHQMTAMTSSGK